MTNVLLFVGVVLATLVLLRIWTGALSLRSIEHESLASIEKRHPYLPRPGAIAASFLIAGTLFALSLRYGTATSLGSIVHEGGMIRTAIVFLGIVLFGIIDQRRWHGADDRHQHLFAFVLGTLVTWILIAFKRSIFSDIGQDPFLMALGITCIVVGWRFLFGPWQASIKCTALGTFLLWSCYAILRDETRIELLATGIAAVVAIVPVAVWCALFLQYHRERLELVLLAFFAGMASTVPILFYSALVERGAELNFFLFRVVPVSFSASSHIFAQGTVGQGTVLSAVTAAAVTYLIVGVIEEVSKYWVLRRSSEHLFRSIDDILQLAIIVSLGFAFAENLANPTYFVGFVKQYLLEPASPAWGPFLGAVTGRGVLTTMVHIVSTGVLGYFLGLALYASPIVKERFIAGRSYPMLQTLHRMLALRTEHLYAHSRIIWGFLLSFILHAVFDFTVSLSEILPGNPQTLGQLLGMPVGSAFDAVPLALLPAALYVVGGFWLLVWLFERSENLQDRGLISMTPAVVQ